MKKSIIYFLVTLITIAVAKAQEGFTAKAGLNNISVSIDAGEFGNASSSELGFYLGPGYNLELSEEFDLEPSVLISFVSELTSIYIPVMAKYKIADGFTLQAGPQINYLLEDVPDGALGVDLAIGAGYHFTKNWLVEARYGFEILRGGDYGEAVSFNTLTIGVGYRFN